MFTLTRKTLGLILVTALIIFAAMALTVGMASKAEAGTRLCPRSHEPCVVKMTGFRLCPRSHDPCKLDRQFPMVFTMRKVGR